MKRLGLSLILVVVVAVIGIGWLVSELDVLTSGADPASNPELAAYERMAQDMARTLDRVPNRQAFLAEWSQASELRFTLGTLADFPVPAELRTGFESGEALILEAEGNISIHHYLPRSGAVLSLVLPDSARGALLRPSLLLTLLFYIGVVAAILLWLYPLVTRLLVLRNAAQAFGHGDLTARVAPNRFSHIGAIEHEFNHMAERIQTLIADNKLLGRAVSHNLKTPLARLRFGFDALGEARDEATREKYAQRIGKDLAEMESLVETLLQYARLDESNIQLQRQRTELNAFVGELIADLDETALPIAFTGSGKPVHLDTDRAYLSLQLQNLLSNALKHARTRILVSVHHTADTARIVVEDDGAGIPPAEWDAVLEPFRRGSNNAGLPGHGMGLAIAARIAHWLDGRVHIAGSAALGGAAVSLHFNLR